MNVDKDIVNYYISQVGGANGVYSGALYQRGQGIGGFLASLFRSCLPILRSRGLAVGKTLLNAGVDMMGDLQNDTPFRESYRNRRGETIGRLKDNIITGNGYNGSRKRKASQSSSRSRVSSVAKKKTKKSPKTHKKKKDSKKKSLKKKIKDIFSHL
jgi:hypothetical protein